MTPLLRPVLCLASLFLLLPGARAQLLGPFTATVAVGFEHDTNVLRAAQGAQSDEIGYLALRVRGDKQYGLQRFRVNADATSYRYRDLSDLSYSTVNYAAAWDWQITPRFQGVLSAERREYRDVSRSGDVGTEQPGGTGGRTDRTELLEGRYLIDGPWRALAGVSHTSSTSREANLNLGDAWDASPTIRSVRVGAAYEFASGSSVTARLRRGDGEYRNRPSGLTSADFRENEAELAVRWPLTVKTRLDARLAYLERDHDADAGLDFSGPVGHATVSWDVTGKTQLVAGLSSDLYSYQVNAPGHVRSDRFFLKPVWKPTAQTAVSLRLVRETRDVRGMASGFPDTGRRDRSHWVIAAFEWEPRRNVAVSATARHERRSSSVPALRYRSSAIGAAIAVSF